MTQRNRAALILGIGTLIVATTLGFVFWRAYDWSERGWIGISFFPADASHMPGFMESRGYGPGGIYMVMPGSPGSEAGLDEGDRIISISGIPLGESERLVELDRSVSAGDRLSYEILREGEELVVDAVLGSPFNCTLVTTMMITGVLSALIFFAIGVFVLWRKPSEKSAVIFFAITVIAAVSLATAGLINVESGTMRGVTADTASLTVPFVAMVGFLLGPLIAHLSLIYPRERPILRSLPEVLRWIYGIPAWGIANFFLFPVMLALGTGKGQIQIQGRAVHFDIPDLTRAVVIFLLATVALAVLARWVYAFIRWGWTWRVISKNPFLVFLSWIFLFSPAVVVASKFDLVQGPPAAALALAALFGPLLGFVVLPIVSCVSFFRSYVESDDVEEKRQLRWPLWALIVGVGGRVVLSIVWFFVVMYFFIRFAEPIPSVSVAIAADVINKLLYLLIPVAFAFSILKYRLMEVDLVIRKTILYTLVSGIVAFLWLAVAGGVGALIVQTTHIEDQTVAVAATLFVALIFVPLRNRLQQLVDRRYQQTAEGLTMVERRIGRNIADASDLDALLRTSVQDIQQALQATAATFLLPESGGRARMPASIGIAEAQRDLPVDLDRFRNLVGVTNVAADDGLREDESLQRIRAHTLVPLKRKGSLVGLLTVGRRIDRREWSRIETDFLSSIADQIAVGIDNMVREDDSEEFEQARDIQRALLPSEIPQLPGLSIAGSWEPAKSVGGDYYDVLLLDENRVGVCIADVAGKGMPAALLMSNLQAVVRAMAARDDAPAALCRRVRSIITSNLSGGKFITFFYCLANVETGELKWANAGHLVPILISADGSVLRLEEGGPAFARLFSALDYDEGVIELAPGDRLLLFTDGVTEAEDEDGEQLGEDRLIEQLVARRAELHDAETLRSTVLEIVHDFSGGNFNDDVTLVAVSWD